MPQTKNKKNARNKTSKTSKSSKSAKSATNRSDEQEAIYDRVDETADCLVDDVVDDTDTETYEDSDEDSEDFDRSSNEIVENVEEGDGTIESNEERESEECESQEHESQEHESQEHESEERESAEEIKNYTNYDKEVMVKKISRLGRREHKIIRRIIKAHKPDKKMKKVTGGSYLYFHNLDDRVYHEIDKFLDDVDRKTTEQFQRYMSETENACNSTEERKSSDIDSTTKPRYRLSNRERHMLNRQRFDKVRSEEIRESIQMNHIKREKDKKNRNIDLTASDRRTRTINIGTSDINTVLDTLDTLSQPDNHDRHRKAKKANKTTKGKDRDKRRRAKEKNIFSKN